MRRLLSFIIALTGLTLGCAAAPVKVFSWNLEQEPGTATPVSVKDVTGPLKEAAPDIILLQSVRDWDFCTELAQALKPADYKVALCTAFGEGKESTRQMAILSLHKAYFSWSEPWTNQLAGGFAFAAFSIADQRVGVFSLSMDLAASLDVKMAGELGGSAARQALGQFQLVRSWKANQPRIVIAGGTFQDIQSDKPLEAFKTAGFRDSLGQLTNSDRATIRAGGGKEPAITDALLVWPADKTSPGRVLRSGKLLHYPMVAEVAIEANPAAQGAGKTEKRSSRKEPTAATNAPSKSIMSTNPVPAQKAPGANISTNSYSSNTTARALERVPLLKPTGEVYDPLKEEFQPGGKQETEARNRQILWALLATIGISFFGICVLVLRNRAQRWTVVKPLQLSERNPPGSAYTIVNTESLTSSDAMSLQPARIEQPAHSPTLSRALHASATKPVSTEDELLRAGLRVHLSHWLKQKFVRRLLTDRERMLQAQSAATAKSLEAQQTLSRIEERIHQQNALYQARIDALARELSAAREENRELIRARIAEAREEMEAARARILGDRD